jgi:hypothetical protein
MDKRAFLKKKALGMDYSVSLPYHLQNLDHNPVPASCNWGFLPRFRVVNNKRFVIFCNSCFSRN